MPPSSEAARPTTRRSLASAARTAASIVQRFRLLLCGRRLRSRRARAARALGAGCAADVARQTSLPSVGSGVIANLGEAESRGACDLVLEIAAAVCVCLSGLA